MINLTNHQIASLHRVMSREHPWAPEIIIDYVDAWIDVRVLDPAGKEIHRFEMEPDGVVHPAQEEASR
jgi:hypothetical protein